MERFAFLQNKYEIHFLVVFFPVHLNCDVVVLRRCLANFLISLYPKKVFFSISVFKFLYVVGIGPWMPKTFFVEFFVPGFRIYGIQKSPTLVLWEKSSFCLFFLISRIYRFSTTGNPVVNFIFKKNFVFNYTRSKKAKYFAEKIWFFSKFFDVLKYTIGGYSRRWLSVIINVYHLELIN